MGRLAVSGRDLDSLRQLWFELGDFPVSQCTQAMDHALGRLAELIGVERIWWLGSRRPAPGETVQAPWLGWEVLMAQYLEGTGDDLGTIRKLGQRVSENQLPRFHVLRLQIEIPCHVTRPVDLMTESE